MPDTLPTPSPQARLFIVLVALLQGLLLYGAQTALEQGWWPLSTLGGRVGWYALVLSVPTLATLTVVRLDDQRFWQHVLGATLVFVLLSAWAAWSAGGTPTVSAQAVLGPFGCSLALALFITLPYLQCRQVHGRWCAPYPELFEWAWQNTLTLALTAVFTGLCWAVLWLCAGLFKLIGITFFSDLFSERAFVYLATGTMVGLGILVTRSQPQAVRVARQILLAIFKGILPLLACIAVLFALALPFTGLQPLWDTRHASMTLFMLLLMLLVFANAVFQDGLGARPYPLPVRRVVEGALLLMPLFALIALYALWLRIAQYGWTQSRYWAVLVALVLLGHALGYAVAVLRRGTAWLPGLPRTNVVMSLAVVALAVASNSPLLDPHRLSVTSQLARLDPSRPETLDLQHLRFESGRRGVQALQALQDDPALADAGALQQALQTTLAQPLPGQRVDRPTGTRTAEQLRQHLQLAPGVAPPDDAWLALALPAWGGACAEQPQACVLLTPDLDGDGSPEHLLCDLRRPDWAPCRFWYRAGDTWAPGEELPPLLQVPGSSLHKALRQGRYRVEPRRWGRFVVPGQSAGPGDEGPPPR